MEGGGWRGTPTQRDGGQSRHTTGKNAYMMQIHYIISTHHIPFLLLRLYHMGCVHTWVRAGTVIAMDPLDKTSWNNDDKKVSDKMNRINLNMTNRLGLTFSLLVAS